MYPVFNSSMKNSKYKNDELDIDLDLISQTRQANKTINKTRTSNKSHNKVFSENY